MKLARPIPNYSTVSRRQGALQVPVFALPQSGPRHVVIAATGLRVYGAGEWRVVKHDVCRRRTWRKLHLGIDERTKESVAVDLTGSRIHDSQPLPSLLAQIPDPIGQVSSDGAYDTQACYEAVLHGSYWVARRPQPYPPAHYRTRMLGVATTQRLYAAECRREYHVPIQDALWGAALGAGPGNPTHRSGGEMRGAQSYDAVGHA
jgi:hypothetical protein